MQGFYTNVALARNDILLRGYDEHGRRVSRQIPYKPYLFLDTKESSKYKTLDKKPVDRIDFDTIKEARDFVNQYKDVDNFNIYGFTNYIYPFIYDHYPAGFKYDPAIVSVVSIDIEVDILNGKGFPDPSEAENEVTLITLSRRGKKVVLGCGDYESKDPNIQYYKCKDEVTLLTLFIKIWNSSEYSPDIVTGWNIEFFDIPYLINRIIRVLGERSAKKLSPWNFIREQTIRSVRGEEQTFIIEGINILDYLQLYKKFGFKQLESYTLDHVASEELGERKLDYGEYGSLAGLQKNNWEMYCDYNIRDVDLIDKLDDELKLIELVMTMAYDARVNYADTFTTVRLWDVLIHNYLMDHNIVIHQYSHPLTDRGIMGGYVKEVQTGMHRWVISLDLTSLYPHIIRQYNISPEMYRGKIPSNLSIDDLLEGKLKDVDFNKEYSITANLCLFDNTSQGFLPAIMQKLFEGRTTYKKKMIESQAAYEKCVDKNSEEAVALKKDISRYKNLQLALKIELNAGYGALANVWNRWYQTDLAEAITSSGQLTTRWIEKKLNQFFNKLLQTTDVDYVIACDTDSVYIRMSDLVDATFEDQSDTKKIIKFMDRVSREKLEPYITRCYDELASYMNAYGNHMHMKRECLADKAIWTAKKRYILNVYDEEGVSYETPKLKMMGIEAIRTSTPASCRKAIKEALRVLMEGDEISLQGYISKFRDEFDTMPFTQIAFPRSVSDLEKYEDPSTIYKKGTPIAVKGALIYNHALRKAKLDTQYERISSGQKIKFSYLKTPNPLQATVISCSSEIPRELALDSYVDKSLQFEKAFLEPMRTITSAIGWHTEHKATLESFFE